MKCQRPISWNIFRKKSFDLRFGIAGLLLSVFFNLIALDAEAAVTSQFSLLVGEEYNDNIFFQKDKEHDFITSIRPTLSILYAPSGQSVPTFRFQIAPEAQIFARHGAQDNFGRNLSLSSGYTYPYSPRLKLYLSDTLQLHGATRTGFGSQEGSGRLYLPTASGTATQPVSTSQGLGDFVSTGDTLSNNFSAGGSFEYSPTVRFSAGYSLGYNNFLDLGGNEIAHTVTAMGIYQWRQQHNLHAGYSLGILKSRDGDDNIIHSFDIGDDFFSTQLIQLTPTFTLSFSTGISLNAGKRGPRVVNNSNLALIKIWETASFTVGVRKHMTESFGVSGPSDTTTFSTNFSIRVTERLTGHAGVDYALFDTDDVNFSTFSANAGLQYSITHWLCSNLGYNHRWIDSGAGATNTSTLNRGTVSGNRVFLTFTAHFDVWPSPGLARTPACPIFSAPSVVQPVRQ